MARADDDERDGVMLLHGDCREVMATLPENSVDAIVTDPPYGLEFMGKEWDRLGKPNGGSDWSQRRATGKDWKGKERERPSRLYMRSSHQTCQLCRKQKHQHDDVACPAPAYELETHEPTQMRVMQEWHESWAREAYRVLKPGAWMFAFGGTRTVHRLTCAIEDAGFEIRDKCLWLTGQGFPKSHNLHGEWEGWGTALKPGHEDVVLARKPLIGTVSRNVSEHGTGALNIAATRIQHQSEADLQESERKNQHTLYANPNSNRDSYSGDFPPRTDYDGSLGRWPANICLDEDAAELLGEPSRFFYTAKASRAERNAGLDGMPERMTGMSNGAQIHGEGYDAGQGIGLNRVTAKANHHPTVKPIALMRWLCRLVTPPGGLVLDPFCGSGSTGIAAALEGFDFIGIEQDAEYLAIAERRIAHWTREATKADSLGPLFELAAD